MFPRVLLLLSGLAFGLAGPAIAPAYANGDQARPHRGSCASGACSLKPSKVVDTSSARRHVRVQHHVKVVPTTKVVNHNKLILHRHTTNHDHLTVHKTKVVHKLTVLHRHNTYHRRAFAETHRYRERHIYNHVKVVQHRHVAGANVWCGCAQYASSY